MKINIKGVAILFVVLFLSFGLGKQCDAQKNDLWGDVDKIYIKIRDFQFKVKNGIKIYEFKKGLAELKVLENGLRDDWEEEIDKDARDLEEKIEKFRKKGKEYKLSPQEKESSDRKFSTLKILTIIYAYGAIEAALDSNLAIEELVQLKGGVFDPDDEDDYIKNKKLIPERINQMDTDIRELKDNIRKYYKK